MQMLHRIQRSKFLLYPCSCPLLWCAQELVLFNPKLALKPQVVVVNKIDLPEVAERLPDTLAMLKKECGHNRVMAVSAATGILGSSNILWYYQNL